MNVTWEVRRKLFNWKTVYSCSGTDPQSCYVSALKVMRQWKEFYPNIEWELRGY